MGTIYLQKPAAKDGLHTMFPVIFFDGMHRTLQWLQRGGSGVLGDGTVVTKLQSTVKEAVWGLNSNCVAAQLTKKASCIPFDFGWDAVHN